ncbi:MAG TPA: hypothetical protein DD666_03300 [Advenella kashmirensis]|uniref:Uncharacterized protein n=1 Tax=Advenella kashmirensis TaxID=310575 RepID=A0A356LBS3_9BURK|nr:hypothetical protein [Advenella kashmirensis]
MKQQHPLSREDLIKIRDTIRSEQVRVLLREISRLHTVVRRLKELSRQVELEAGMGVLHDSPIFDDIARLLDNEMRLYGPPPFKRTAADKQHRADECMTKLEGVLDVRKNKTG